MSGHEPLRIVRHAHPRLFHLADDAEFAFARPKDRVRRFILENMLKDAEAYAAAVPWKHIPERLDSPHPSHQVYLTFDSALQATALIEHYTFLWRITKDERWLELARRWLLAASAWEHSDRIWETFYISNKYMGAFALALDMLDDQLADGEKQRVTECLIGLLRRWWPDVNENRHSKIGDHHTCADHGHFGLAALHLLGKHEEAVQWTEGVVDRFRSGIMPYGCGEDGSAVDGYMLWPWENLWMLKFCHALRNVTGINLHKEFPQRAVRPVNWMKYHFTGHDCLLIKKREMWSPVLLALAQHAGDGGMRDVSLSDTNLGRIYNFGDRTKNCSAVPLSNAAPFAYCFYDPAFKPRKMGRTPPPSRKFACNVWGAAGVLRSDWKSPSLVAYLSAYSSGLVPKELNDFRVHWAGFGTIKSIACEEATPVECGNVPCVGGQNQYAGTLGNLVRTEAGDHICASLPRVDQELWLVRGRSPLLVAALRRKARGVRVMQERNEAFVRTDGCDYLQYPRADYFNPNEGILRLRARFGGPAGAAPYEVLFHTGLAITGGPGRSRNSFTLGFFGEDALVFGVSDRYSHSVRVKVPCKRSPAAAGKWHDITVRWGGFNTPGAPPFIELQVDGRVSRQDDASAFVMPRRVKGPSWCFTVDRPRTAVVFGAALQGEGSGLRCDISRIELKCPRRRRLKATFESGLENETGSGPLTWKLHPVALRRAARARVMLGAGSDSLEVLPAYPDGVFFERTIVPFAPIGLAASAIIRESEEPSVRVTANAGGADDLILVFAPAKAHARVVRRPGGFLVKAGSEEHVFEVRHAPGPILCMKEGPG